MNRDRELARHFLAAIAYRTQKALRGAPATRTSRPGTRCAPRPRSCAT